MVFLFLAAVSLFGTLVSQLNEIVANQTKHTKALEDTLELYLGIRPRYIRTQLKKKSIIFEVLGVYFRLDVRLMLKIRGWERFVFSNTELHEKVLSLV